MPPPPAAKPTSLSGSDFYVLSRPSECPRRVYLNATGVAKAKANPYEEVLERLGRRHEAAYLATLGPYTDLSKVAAEERVERTKQSIKDGVELIYQPRFQAVLNLAGHHCTVVGEPDFLLKRDGGYVIRDAKMSRRITEDAHPEILRQLETYGWLYSQTAGASPIALEVFSGKGELVTIATAPTEQVLAALERIAALKTTQTEPYSPVGWTKCGACTYHSRCWPAAEKAHDVAMLPRVDQGLAIALREAGVRSRDDLLAKFDEQTLADFQRPWGKKTQRVGNAAAPILRAAEATRDNREIVLQPPALPTAGNFVVFDLEGLPPHLDELDKIFLWGLQVLGEEPSAYTGVVAGIGEAGDRQGWQDFLNAASAVFDHYGEIPWLHWAPYEKTKLSTYITRFEDPSGIAARVKANLVDLLPITQASVVLPLPSYSLKVVEEYVGFKRTQEEYGGTWAMAKFIEATECEREEDRKSLIQEILTYNEEDLKATWAVLEWLRNLAKRQAQGSE